MDMKINPVFDKPAGQPVVIAGPCSAESEEQVLTTARALAKQNIDLFRSGIWKPRTRPGSFEGVGVIGLKWLQKVKKETGLPVTTEVANREHVFEALKHGIDVLWLGARTTVNPFSVQEVADALKGVDIPVMIKNPINPDVKLWMGAIERIAKAGITKIGVIHRGFSSFGNSNYRNEPMWQLAIELKRLVPGIQMVCDNSHICGRRDTLGFVAQRAMDLQMDGLMTEVHPTPDEAWSDAAQQITPAVFGELVKGLKLRKASTNDVEFLEHIDDLRHQIDEIDNNLLNLYSQRMKLAENIGKYKKKNNISILQSSRWNEILEQSMAKGREKGLSDGFVTQVLTAIHQESINHQTKVMNVKSTAKQAKKAKA
ncbi:MAG: bifunctional 3-deoxy-7-phosphoheptulonate synthase/chorismate mutase type II [Saprospiraceae bacterium]